MTSLAALRFRIEEAVSRAVSPADLAEEAAGTIDELVRDAPGRSFWACKKGCAACCHLLVRVKPAEVEAIVRFVESTFDAHEQRALLDGARRVAARVTGMEAGAYRRARVRCAFLDEQDLCSVYAVRPVKCRVHASRDAMACSDPETPVPFDAGLAKIGDAVHHGLPGDEGIELHRAYADRAG